MQTHLVYIDNHEGNVFASFNITHSITTSSLIYVNSYNNIANESKIVLHGNDFYNVATFNRGALITLIKHAPQTVSNGTNKLPCAGVVINNNSFVRGKV